MAKTIRVTVDEMTAISGETRNARPDLQQLVLSCLQKTVEVEADAIKGSIAGIYSNVVEMIQDLPDDSSAYQLDTVSFSVVVDAQGKASLFSAVSGGVRTQTGLNFVISRRNEQ